MRPEAGSDPALASTAGGMVDEAERTSAEMAHTRAEIERTRADMGETVDAIQERLSPESLKEQAKDRVKEATVGKVKGAGSTVVETIKENPLPAVLTGIGLSWLFVSGRKRSLGQPHYRYRAYDYAPTHDYPLHNGERRSDGSSAGQAIGQARDKVGETASQAQDKAGQVVGSAQDKIEETASQAQDKAGQIADRTQDQASRLANQAQYQAKRAKSGFERMLRENPLTMGTLAVGVGAAVGLAVPETAKEHEVMGETRDNLVDKAQEKAQETQQKVQRVAEEAQSTVQQEAQNQGLTNQ